MAGQEYDISVMPVDSLSGPAIESTRAMESALLLEVRIVSVDSVGRPR
jgi:hypothetical protein